MDDRTPTTGQPEDEPTADRPAPQTVEHAVALLAGRWRRGAA